MFPLDKPAQSQAASNGEQVFLIGSMVTWCNVDRTTFLFCSSSTAMPQHKYWNTKKQQLNFRMLEYIYMQYIYIYLVYFVSIIFRHIFVTFSSVFLHIFWGKSSTEAASSWISWVKETTPISLGATRLCLQPLMGTKILTCALYVNLYLSK